MKKRKICVVITARPSYSRVKSALKAIREHPSLELQLVVAGSALLTKYGNAVDFIQDDGFKVDEKVYMVLEGETPTSMAKTCGLGLIEFSTTFNNLQPDAVMVIADRYETLSVSIAAAYQNIPLVHLQGGEVTGNIDEKVRHANTKLADIHFVASEGALKRVLQLGEDPAYVFNTGCPSIDIAAEVLESPTLDFDPFEKYLGSGTHPDLSHGYLVVMQHPVTTEYQLSGNQVEETLHAVNDINMPTLWFWPNLDAGGGETSSAIRKFRENFYPKNIHFFKNMNPEDFLRLLFNSKCLIGNSSVGIRECSFLAVPTVNIGSRQFRRDRGKNIVDVDYNRNDISSAIRHWLNNGNPKQDFVYGTGEAGKKIADILATVNLRFHKTITY